VGVEGVGIGSTILEEQQDFVDDWGVSTITSSSDEGGLVQHESGVGVIFVSSKGALRFDEQHPVEVLRAPSDVPGLTCRSSEFCIIAFPVDKSRHKQPKGEL
jgi:hypothetical protein